VIAAYDGRDGDPARDDEEDRSCGRRVVQKHERYSERGGNMRAGERDGLYASVFKNPEIEDAALG
jgi:hypothetical protein